MCLRAKNSTRLTVSNLCECSRGSGGGDANWNRLNHTHRVSLCTYAAHVHASVNFGKPVSVRLCVAHQSPSLTLTLRAVQWPSPIHMAGDAARERDHTLVESRRVECAQHAKADRSRTGSLRARRAHSLASSSLERELNAYSEFEEFARSCAPEPDTVLLD